MEDPVLNRNLEETKELHTRWSQFRDFVAAAIKTGKVTPQAEMKFLELKSRIAMLHDGFLGSLEHDHKTGQNILTIVGDCILLNRVANYNASERQKFEFDWNECYMLLTEQIGTLDEEKKRLANINERVYKATQRKERMEARIHNFLQSAGFKFTVGMIIAFMLIWGIPAFGIYDYRNLEYIGGVGVVYKIFTNGIYRPWFDEELEYGKFETIEENEKYDPVEVDPANFKRAKSDEYTEKYFKDNVLRQIGIHPDDIVEARALIDGRKHFDKEAYFAGFGRGKNEVQFYYLLMNSGADAQRIVELAKNGLDVHQENTAAVIRETAFVARRSNFLAISIGEHPLRSGHIADRWKFGEGLRNLLDL